MNYLYEIGTAKQLILRPYTARELNGKQYEANEPYTLLRDVDITLVYGDLSSEVANARQLLKRQNIGINNVLVSGVSLTSKILALMSTRVDDTQVEVTKSYTVRSDNGTTLYLNHIPNLGSAYVYDTSGNRVAVTVVDNKLIGVFEVDAPYLVFYTIFVEQEVFNLNVPQYGYFSLEASGVGNKDKVGTTYYLNFPTVSLLPQPTSTINGDGLIGSVLDFAVITTKEGGAPIIAL